MITHVAAAGAALQPGVEMLQADAGTTDACAGAVPARIVVVCGIFGAHRLTGEPAALVPGQRLFTFVAGT